MADDHEDYLEPGAAALNVYRMGFGESLSIGENEQVIIHGAFYLESTAVLTVTSTGEFVVIGG